MGVFFPLSFQHLAVIFAFMRIPFGVLLLSIARQPIKMDHTVGLLHLLTEKPRHTSGPSLARDPTSLSDHFFIYLTEK